jgi:hypothetical protein
VRGADPSALTVTRWAVRMRPRTLRRCRALRGLRMRWHTPGSSDADAFGLFGWCSPVWALCRAPTARALRCERELWVIHGAVWTLRTWPYALSLWIRRAMTRRTWHAHESSMVSSVRAVATRAGSSEFVVRSRLFGGMWVRARGSLGMRPRTRARLQAPPHTRGLAEARRVRALACGRRMNMPSGKIILYT